MDFRTRIKEICQEKGITQKELADILGITDISLNKSLRGEYPQLQTLEKIANALQVPVTELFEQPKSNVYNCPHCGKEIRAEK
jgi:transcriptional regulator with XRE-family HTH domain